MNNPESVQNLRHTSAHLLAAAVLELYPGVKLTIGPAIEQGFYYDFDLSETGQTITEEDFAKIENKMGQLRKTWRTFTKREVTEEEAKEFYKDNQYKLELIDEII